MSPSRSYDGPYDARADLLIVSGNALAARRAEAAAAALDLRVIETIAPDDAGRALAAHGRADLVLVMLGNAEGGAIEALAGPLCRAIEEAGLGCVIAVPMALLDAAHAAFGDGAAELLCAPSDVELAGALGLAARGRDARLHEPGPEAGRDELAALSEEVGRIARALAALSGGENDRQLGEAPFAYRPAPAADAPSLDAGEVRAMIRLRRLRDRFFAPDLFADPAWDMLLDLMAARFEGQQVAVSSLCIAAAVPPTTALRWIRTMTAQGLFERRADPADGRRVFIALADGAADALARWFAAARREGLAVIA